MSKSDAKSPQFPADTINGPSIDSLQSKHINKDFSVKPSGLATSRKKGKKSPKASGKDSSEESVCSQSGQQDFAAEQMRTAFGHDVACLCDHFNTLLAKSPLAAGGAYLPLKEGNVIDKLVDGVMLCAMANVLKPGLVDEAAVVRGAALMGPDGQSHATHNVNLGLTSLHMVGVCTLNISTLMICSTKPLCVINLLLQVLRLATVCRFNLKDNEQLVYMFDNWSDKDELINIKNISRKEMLWQWVNYQLKKAGTGLQLNEFTSLADSMIYANLLLAVSPQGKKASLKSIEEIKSVKDLVKRAALVVNNASTLGILGSESIRPEHIAGASKCGKPNSSADIQRIYILNLAFLFRIYSRYPNIDVPTKKLDSAISEVLKGSDEQGATEDTLRMWLNSFGPEPPVAYLFTDLCNGAVLLQVWESITPGCVNWSKVDLRDTKLPKRKFVWLSNCEEVMECAKKHGIKVDCAASDLATGDILKTLALVFKMMWVHAQLHRKRNSSSKLEDLDDKGLVLWFNKQMKKHGSTFQLTKLGEDTLRNTNVLCYLAERVLTEQGQLNIIGDSANPTWLIDSVDGVIDRESWIKYSSSTITLLRKGGVCIYTSLLNPEVDKDVCRDVLLQLNGLCE